MAREYSSKMIQRCLEVKPACDMLQDSGTWGPNTIRFVSFVFISTLCSFVCKSEANNR